MTREQINELHAGGYMDSLIAHHIFNDGLRVPAADYSTDIADAWKVVEKIPARIAIWPVTLNGEGWAACIGNELATVMTSGWSGTATTKAETPALAICRCALLYIHRATL